MQNTDNPAGSPSTESPTGKPAYREQLSAPKSWYLIAVAFGVCFGLIFLVINTLWLAPAALVGVSLLSCWAVAAYGRLRIEVAADGITAGAAQVPAAVLGKASALDRESARALLTYKADARAFLLLRSYVPTGVRVENIDPADQTPYLYLSSRRPEELAAAVNALGH